MKGRPPKPRGIGPATPVERITRHPGRSPTRQAFETRRLTMRLRALLDTDVLGLRLLGGEDELDRTVRGVMTTDLRDPSRYLTGGELVLTGLAWRHEAADSESFAGILAAAGVAGLAAGEADGPVPADLVAARERHHLPLFAV